MGRLASFGVIMFCVGLILGIIAIPMLCDLANNAVAFYQTLPGRF